MPTVERCVSVCSSSMTQQALGTAVRCSLSDTHYCIAQDTYILDAGLDAGVELPYTCRGGICGCGAPLPDSIRCCLQLTCYKH